MREIQVGRVYRHFKNKYYLVVAIAIHSETDENYVVYKQLYGEGLVYIRPYNMFASEVDREKYPEVTQKYRFECVNAFAEESAVPLTEEEQFDIDYAKGGWRQFRDDGQQFGLDPDEFETEEEFEEAVQNAIAGAHQGY